MITPWNKAKVKFEPHYSVSNRRNETIYAMPLVAGDEASSLEVAFRFANREELEGSPPDTKGKVNIEFVMTVKDDNDESLMSFQLDKADVMTLMKLLTNALEHSTVRRFQWLTEVTSETEEPERRESEAPKASERQSTNRQLALR